VADQALYSTLAQVIPVFVLTGLVELRFIERIRTASTPDHPHPWSAAAWMSPRTLHKVTVIVVGAVFVFSVLGALAAIASTQSESVPGYDHVFAKFGLATSVVFVVLPVLGTLTDMWRDGPPKSADD
jgi:hypothetical protein